MIKISSYYSDLDFIKRYERLDNTAWADERLALGVLYDHLSSLDDEALSDMDIRDWLRFQVVEMTEEEIEINYNLQFVGYSTVEYFLNDYTMLYGTYNHNGKVYYLFGEF